MPIYVMRFRRLYLLALPVITLMVIALLAYRRNPFCADFTDMDRSKLVTYFQARYGLGKDSNVEVESGGTLVGTCLRRISVLTTPSARRIPFILSENKRFVFSDASDLNGPVKALAPPTSVTSTPISMMELTANNPPSSGPANAPVTMVVFSDFQCPFCKRFGQSMREVETKNPQRLRVVFREYPLSIHEHARQEAELAACTSRQSAPAFWALHDYFFSVTTTGSKGGSVDGALDLLRTRKDIKIGEVEHCLSNHQEAATVDRDLDMGKKYGVSGTPTIFINGTRMVGAKDAAALAQIVEDREKAAGPETVTPNASKGGL